ncbi:hypothetical protein SNOUR_26585 [Streptomyces noursei ATCC 11455]|nr:hypothetical protein SNOUR_26585 [Streptomyces noursei ATCC 11455]
MTTTAALPTVRLPVVDRIRGSPGDVVVTHHVWTPLRRITAAATVPGTARPPERVFRRREGPWPRAAAGALQSTMSHARQVRISPAPAVPASRSGSLDDPRAIRAALREAAENLLAA